MDYGFTNLGVVYGAVHLTLRGALGRSSAFGDRHGQTWRDLIALERGLWETGVSRWKQRKERLGYDTSLMNWERLCAENAHTTHIFFSSLAHDTFPPSSSFWATLHRRNFPPYLPFLSIDISPDGTPWVWQIWGAASVRKETDGTAPLTFRPSIRNTIQLPYHTPTKHTDWGLLLMCTYLLFDVFERLG